MTKQHIENDKKGDVFGDDPDKPPVVILPTVPPNPIITGKPFGSDSGRLTPVGRIKAPPVCRVPAFKKESLSSAELSKMCFDPEQSITFGTLSSSSDLPLSSSSSTASNTELSLEKMSSSKPVVSWGSFKRSVLTRTASRNGRERQRFAKDPITGQAIRLTTGSVPIMADGRILLVSSSRKEEWILPKGGWESDESMEMSALRESFEEGGVLGILGPLLTDVEYETKKAKKRRLELEVIKKKYDSIGAMVDSSNVSLSGISVHSLGSTHSPLEEENLMNQTEKQAIHSTENSTVVGTSPLPSVSKEASPDASSPASKECLATKIRETMTSHKRVAERWDDTASVASYASIASDGSSSHNHVRMSMFLLYVIEVKDQWPESGRARKVVDIDTAIEMMTSRPEFQKVLIEVKQKGYHFTSQSVVNKGSTSDSKAKESASEGSLVRECTKNLVEKKSNEDSPSDSI